MWFSWIILGVVIGLVGMLPIIRLLLRRAELRARLAERRARDAERLAELGSMTGGLAHEIKNPLSTVGLNAQLLTEGIRESDLPDDEKQRLLRRLDALSREVERLRGILTDFLQFAGRIKLDVQQHDLVNTVSELADFFHPQCEQAGVLLRADMPEGAISVPIDESLIKQAILNLMINAVQAMAEKPGATSELILRIERDRSEARVLVIDTGPGFDMAQVDELFRPYVSGKRGGTGLGLPTASRIVEEHGGRLTALSEPGKGSEFIIHLPLHHEAMRTGL